MIHDRPSSLNLLALLGVDPSSSLAASVSNDPIMLHDAVLSAIRGRRDAGPEDSAWLANLAAALPVGAKEPPQLDDPAPEANLCEALLLAFAATGERLDDDLREVVIDIQKLGVDSPRRLGHIIQRVPGKSEAQLFPIFAAILAQGARHDALSFANDLGWDALLQARAASPNVTVAELARLALDSPARLLARRPEAIRDFAVGDPAARGESAPSRLLAAAGVPDEAVPLSVAPGASAARVGAVPGALQPSTALRDMITAPTTWKRNEALLGLLMGERTGRVAGVELDLHRDASARIASALPGPREELTPGSDRGARPSDWIRLEIAALHHGAVLAKRAMPREVDRPRRVLAAWVLGDWIGRVLRESPFFGADPELLAARLEAVLPSPIPCDDNDDALWPAAMGTDLSSIHLDELWLIRTLVVAQDKWEPPGAVLDGLRRLADRPLNAAERRAEADLEEGRNALNWPGEHLAPPLAARWLLHLHRAEWLSRIHVDAQQETLRFLETWIAGSHPKRGVWVMLALYREAPQLRALADVTKKIWTSAAERDDLESEMGDALGPFCLWGSTYLATLEPKHAAILARLATQTSASWRVGVLMTIAEAQQASGASIAAREALLGLIKSTSEGSLRLPAAVAAIQLGRKLPEAEREPFLNRVDALLRGDLRAHPSVRVELKRAGRAA
ncbi:MAG: hypothetical protein ABJE95_17190 [Byssovorax sp.]